MELTDEPNWEVHCSCGESYSLLNHTVCPECFLWPSANRNLRVRKAFDLIAQANGVTILSLSEMESLVNRALAGEFDHDLIPDHGPQGDVCAYCGQEREYCYCEPKS